MNSIYSILISCCFATSWCTAQESFYLDLADSAFTLTQDLVQYDPAYRSIPYPGGDVSPDKGVCTDVIIRAYRKVGIDLQKEIHEDMTIAFSKYPAIWGLSHTDRNIDHRRVPNMQVFFTRHGRSLPISQEFQEYLPGDIVTWKLPAGLPHIGIVSAQREHPMQPYAIIHNVGNGQVLENILFAYRITGHYRYSKH